MIKGRDDITRTDPPQGNVPTPNAAANAPTPDADYAPADHAINEFASFDPIKDVPSNPFIFLVGVRRMGKTETVLDMLRKWHGVKRWDTVIVVSQTLSGYEHYVPANHQYRDMSALPTIIERCMDVAEYNATQPEVKDMVRQSTLLVLDDVVGDPKDLRTTGNIIQKLAVQGRHIHRDDPHPTNEFGTILISQRASIIPPVIRTNADLIISSRMSNRRDRQTLIEEALTMSSDRDGLNEARRVFDTVTMSKPYRFCVIALHNATRLTHRDYVMFSDADPKAKPIKLFGTEDDWRTKKERISFS
tara:strand:- start:876 stop:1784 length:909 start_codon:yes stop_codon:yes gene_type:complete